MKSIIGNILLKSAIKFRRLEKYAIPYFIKREGGEIRSQSLRSFYRKVYRIDAGLYTYGCFTPGFNFGGGKISIGRYSSIASGVKFLGANHPIDHFSSSAVFYNKSLGYNVKDVVRHNLTIEDDVWIGTNTCITCGCKRIGRGAVIGAGSIVTKDVEPYTIVAGNPARIIRRRFDDNRIKELEKSAWWEKTPDLLIEEFKGEIYD